MDLYSCVKVEVFSRLRHRQKEIELWITIA